MRSPFLRLATVVPRPASSWPALGPVPGPPLPPPLYARSTNGSLTSAVCVVAVCVGCVRAADAMVFGGCSAGFRCVCVKSSAEFCERTRRACMRSSRRAPPRLETATRGQQCRRGPPSWCVSARFTGFAARRGEAYVIRTVNIDRCTQTAAFFFFSTNAHFRRSHY